MFCRYSLRTRDVDAARRFYTEAIGLELPLGGGADATALEVWTLHERALALGVPPHWLGHLAVDDVDGAADRLVGLGAERLGPPVQTPEGTRYATLRDPLGAVISLRAERRGPGHGPIAWHQLHTQDADRSIALYSELFGLVQIDTVSDPKLEGGHRLFAWNEGGDPIGSIANTGRWPGVHPHWLFYFPVPEIHAAAVRVRSLGGTALDPIALSGHGMLSVCEDPQGAAFGLMGPPR